MSKMHLYPKDYEEFKAQKNSSRDLGVGRIQYWIRCVKKKLEQDGRDHFIIRESNVAISGFKSNGEITIIVSRNYHFLTYKEGESDED